MSIAIQKRSKKFGRVQALGNAGLGVQDAELLRCRQKLNLRMGEGVLIKLEPPRFFLPAKG